MDASQSFSQPPSFSLQNLIRLNIVIGIIILAKFFLPDFPHQPFGVVIVVYTIVAALLEWGGGTSILFGLILFIIDRLIPLARPEWIPLPGTTVYALWLLLVGCVVVLRNRAISIQVTLDTIQKTLRTIVSRIQRISIRRPFLQAESAIVEYRKNILHTFQGKGHAVRITLWQNTIATIHIFAELLRQFLCALRRSFQRVVQMAITRLRQSIHYSLAVVNRLLQQTWGKLSRRSRMNTVVLIMLLAFLVIGTMWSVYSISIILLFVAGLLFRWDGRGLVAASWILLLLVPFLIINDQTSVADSTAALAFYLLLAGLLQTCAYKVLTAKNVPSI